MDGTMGTVLGRQGYPPDGHERLSMSTLRQSTRCSRLGYLHFIGVVHFYACPALPCPLLKIVSCVVIEYMASACNATPTGCLGSGNQLHPAGLHQPALTLSHRTPSGLTGPGEACP